MTGSGLQRVMLASDSMDGLAAALDKALRLADPESGRVVLLRTCHDPAVEEPADVMPEAQRTGLRDALLARCRQDLNALVRSREAAPEIEARAHWTADAAEAIVEAAARWPAGLLIKPVSEHHPVADYFHTPLDWALMRRAPCPVLVSKGDSWRAPGPVLAALDAGDERHAGLCREILRQAAAMARTLDAHLHVVTVYPDLGQTMNELQVAPDFAGIKADMRDSRTRTVTALLEDLADDVDGIQTQLHVVEGRAAAMVAGLAGRLGATLTVLGSAARSGVAKLVLGNTAENLIGRLPGDLLTVREPWS